MTEQESLETMVAAVADEFVERVNRGESPNVEDYARRHPKLARMLRDVLPALELMCTSETGDGNSGPMATENELTGQIGDFRIDREIGRGGMGIVYEAQQISLNRRVALKVLPFAAALDPHRLERFIQEAQAAAQLHHSSIVPVYSVGCERGVYYYAMQFIEGQSVAELIDEMRQMSGIVDGSNVGLDPLTRTANGQTDQGTAPSQYSTHVRANHTTVHSDTPSQFMRRIAEMGVQAAEALEHAHEMGIVHRDVKPANLLVDSRGQLWIADFGLARFRTDANITATGNLLGTYRYMSPEQAEGKHSIVDQRSDVYSLGATLYELAALQPAVRGTNREEVLRQITRSEPTPPRRLNRAIPTDLETIILKAMSADLAGRYSSAREVADDLRRFLDNLPIRAKRPTLVERATKWARRHRAIVASAVVMLVFALIAMSATTVVIAHEQSRTKEAYAQIAAREAATREALATAEEQRELAERNFQSARNILDFVTGLLADRGADLDSPEVRIQMATASLRYYREFVEQAGDDPPLQRQLASSYFQVARILGDLGSTDAAAEAVEHARKIQERLVRRNPTDPGLRRELLDIYVHRGFLKGQSYFWLVNIPRVQTDLELDAEQRRRVKQVSMSNNQLIGEFAHCRDMVEMRQSYEERRKEVRHQLMDILTPSQQSRLSQIRRRRYGLLGSCSHPEVIAALSLTQQQTSDIGRVVAEYRITLNRHLQREDCAAAHDCKHKFTRRVRALLSPEQQEEWESLIGPPMQPPSAPPQSTGKETESKVKDVTWQWFLSSANWG